MRWAEREAGGGGAKGGRQATAWVGAGFVWQLQLLPSTPPRPAPNALRLPRGPPPPCLQLSVSNLGGSPLDGFMIQLNKNALGLAPASQHVALPPVAPGATAAARVPMSDAPHLRAPEQGGLLQVALKVNPLGVLYVNDTIPAALLAPPAPAAAAANPFDFL